MSASVGEPVPDKKEQAMSAVTRPVSLSGDDGFWYVDPYTSNSVFKRDKGRWWDPQRGDHCDDEQIIFRIAYTLVKLIPEAGHKGLFDPDICICRPGAVPVGPTKEGKQ